MKYGLFRDAPFRPLFANGHGFAVPLRDETRALWTFSSEKAALVLRSALHHDTGSGGFVQIAKISLIKERIKTEYLIGEPT